MSILSKIYRYLSFFNRNKSIELAIGSYFELQSESDKVEASALKAKFLGKRRGSLIFLIDKKTKLAPDGVLIKQSFGKQRRLNWNPLDEAKRLTILETWGPKNPEFEYLRAISANDDPEYLMLPYFPSESLRAMLSEAILSDQPIDSFEKIRESSNLAGRWLGKLYEASPRKSSAELLEADDFVTNLVVDLKRFTKPEIGMWFDDHAGDLIDVFDRIQLDHPVYFHGDFNLDNILIGENNKIAFIDPEEIVTSPYGDFLYFLECLVVYLRKGDPRRKSAVRHLVTNAFCEGIQSELSSPNILAEAFLLNVSRKIVWYHKSRKNFSMGLTPSQLFHRNDQRRLMRHFVNWLSAIPKDITELWGYVKTSY